MVSKLSTARLAQLVERKALNLVVVGSSPTVGAFSYWSWRYLRWQEKKIQHPRIELGTFRVLGGRHNH